MGAAYTTPPILSSSKMLSWKSISLFLVTAERDVLHPTDLRLFLEISDGSG